MSYLVAPSWIGFDGQPITGVIPPRLRLMSGVMTPTLASEVAHRYKVFHLNKQASLAEFFVSDDVLPDGSRVRIVANSRIEDVLVWASGDADRNPDLPPIAYPILIDLSYAPIYDRPVIDWPFTPEEYPPEPVFDIPQPSMRTIEFFAIAEVDVASYANTAVSTSHEIRFGGEVLASGTGAASVTRTGQLYTDSVVVYQYSFSNAPVSPDWTYSPAYPEVMQASDGSLIAATAIAAGSSSLGFRAPGIAAIYASYYANGSWSSPVPVTGSQMPETSPTTTIVVRPYPYGPDRSVAAGNNQDGVGGGSTVSGTITATYTLVAAATYALDEQISLTFDNSGAEAAAAATANEGPAYEQRMQEWSQQRQVWLNTVYKAWQDECAAVDERNAPKPMFPALKPYRIQGRATQIAAMKGWLETGLGDMHLNRQILAFPYDVAKMHDPSVATIDLTGGEITVGDTEVIDPSLRIAPITLVNMTTDTDGAPSGGGGLS